MLNLPNIKISVIIPAYNVEKYINRSINSVLNQSFKPFEIIIVDDGSTDDTKKILEKFNDKIVYIYQENSGSSSARNLGIAKAKGDWIAFLDSDDEWVATHLENFAKTLNLFPNVNWYGAPFRMLDEKTKETLFQAKKGHLKENGCHIFFEDYMAAFPPKAYLSSPTMIIKKAIFDNVGGFNVTKKTAVDVDMWFRIALKYPQIGYSYKEGAIVYRRDFSLSTSKKWNPNQSIERFLECEKLAKDQSEAALQRAEPRIMYWVVKLLRSTLSVNDKKTLKTIKKYYFKRLSIKYRITLLTGIYFPFIFQIIKRLK